jgi:hypothetical protein
MRDVADVVVCAPQLAIFHDGVLRKYAPGPGSGSKPDSPAYIDPKIPASFAPPADLPKVNTVGERLRFFR